MEVKDKKQMIVSKMYDQNATGGKGASPKFKMNGQNSGKGGGMAYTMHGKNTGKSGGEGTNEANSSGSFKGKYNQGKKSSMAQKMVNGSVKPSQKGKTSLNSTGKNEGEKMMLGKNEHNRA